MTAAKKRTTKAKPSPKQTDATPDNGKATVDNHTPPFTRTEGNVNTNS